MYIYIYIGAGLDAVLRHHPGVVPPADAVRPGGGLYVCVSKGWLETLTI